MICKSRVLFEGRNLLIASKHCKELAVAPVMESTLGVICFTDRRIDTDILGTFTGEVKRRYDPLTTVKQKCLMGLELTGCDLVIANEGSFGPHPTIPFASADEEWLCFMDRKNGIEIVVREISVNTNFSRTRARVFDEVKLFAENVGFALHGIILRPYEDKTNDIVKGITDYKVLEEAFYDLAARYGEVVIETDMRAMFNPTRMSVIRKAAESLAGKICSNCPDCNWPGFGVVDIRTGLPCEFCGSPTQSTKSHIYSCQKCNASRQVLFPHGKRVENPQYCDYCNP